MKSRYNTGYNRVVFMFEENVAQTSADYINMYSSEACWYSELLMQNNIIFIHARLLPLSILDSLDNHKNFINCHKQWKVATTQQKLSTFRVVANIVRSKINTLLGMWGWLFYHQKWKCFILFHVQTMSNTHNTLILFHSIAKKYIKQEKPFIFYWIAQKTCISLLFFIFSLDFCRNEKWMKITIKFKQKLSN